MHTNLEIKTKTHCKGGGGQKSGVLDRGPCGDLARMFAKFRKLFLPRAQGISERTNRFRIALVEPLLNLQPASRTWQQPETLGAGASCAHKLCGGKSGINAQEAVLASVLWKIGKSANIHVKSGATSQAQDCTGDCPRGRADCAGVRPEGRD